MKPATEHETLDHDTLPKQLLGASHGAGSESQFLSTGHLFCHDMRMWKRFSIQQPSRLAHHVPNPPPLKRHRPLNCWTSCADGVRASWRPRAGYCSLRIITAFVSRSDLCCGISCTLLKLPGFSGAVLIHQDLDLSPHSSMIHDDEQS